MDVHEVVVRFEDLRCATHRAHELSRRGWVDQEWMEAWSEVLRLQQAIGDDLAALDGAGPIGAARAPSAPSVDLRDVGTPPGAGLVGATAEAPADA